MPNLIGINTAPAPTAARRRPDRAEWRLARSILVTETDQEAADYLSDDRSSYGWYYAYLRDNLVELQTAQDIQAKRVDPR